MNNRESIMTDARFLALQKYAPSSVEDFRSLVDYVAAYLARIASQMFSGDVIEDVKTWINALLAERITRTELASQAALHESRAGTVHAVSASQIKGVPSAYVKYRPLSAILRDSIISHLKN